MAAIFNPFITKLCGVVLQILLFRHPAPSPGKLIYEVFQSCRHAVLEGGEALTQIPPELSYARIVHAQPGHETPPPISRNDFLHYLNNQTHTAEQLRFILFVLLYTKKHADLVSQRAFGLSPPWTEEDEKSVRRSILLARRESRTTSLISTTPPPTANSNEFTDFGIYSGPSSIKSIYTPPSSAGGDSSAFVRTNSLLSSEIEKCLATYICHGAPHQLNLSDLDQACLLQALKQSNHPAVFRLVVQQVENDLRASHREFIHFILSTPELPALRSHLLVSRLIGATNIILSLAAAVIMTVSKISRGFIAVIVPFFFAGVVSSFVAQRELFVWCGEGLEEVEGRGKTKLQGTVLMQGLWAGVIATSCFCALLFVMPKCNKF